MKGCPRRGLRATLPVKIQTKDGLKIPNRVLCLIFAFYSAGRDAHTEVGILGCLVGQAPPSWPESPTSLGEGSKARMVVTGLGDPQSLLPPGPPPDGQKED